MTPQAWMMMLRGPGKHGTTSSACLLEVTSAGVVSTSTCVVISPDSSTYGVTLFHDHRTSRVAQVMRVPSRDSGFLSFTRPVPALDLREQPHFFPRPRTPFSPSRFFPKHTCDPGFSSFRFRFSIFSLFIFPPLPPGPVSLLSTF